MFLNLTKQDICKLFIPVVWILFSFVAFISYLVIPVKPRLNAAVSWAISTCIASLLTINIWTFHRKESYDLLPEPISKKGFVNKKIIFASILSSITLIMALYFWIIGDPHTYADGCAYTVSCIFSIIWLIDLYKNQIFH